MKVWVTLIVSLLVVFTHMDKVVLAQSVCTNPGTFNAGAGSQYEYDAAENAYQMCLNTVPTNTPTPTPTPLATSTPTPTPTVEPTAAAIATETGCIPESTNAYKTCVLIATTTVADSHIAWWTPVLAIILLGGFVLGIRRH